MPADRDILTRGALPPPSDYNGRTQPTPPSARRAPSMPRERKPALAALAVLLIAGGALGAAYLVTQNGQRVAAVEITQPVSLGEQIPASALTEVQIAPGSGLSYVTWADAAQVTRYYAATAIPPGTLLTSAMVAPASHLASGMDVVGLSLKDGQWPTTLQVGDHVDIYQVSDSQDSCPGSPGSVLSAGAVVVGIGTPAVYAGNSSVDVRLAVNPADAGAVTCNAANNLAGIAVLPSAPAGGSGQAPAAPSAGASSSASPSTHQRGHGKHGGSTPTSSPSQGAAG